MAATPLQIDTISQLKRVLQALNLGRALAITVGGTVTGDVTSSATISTGVVSAIGCVVTADTVTLTVTANIVPA